MAYSVVFCLEKYATVILERADFGKLLQRKWKMSNLNDRTFYKIYNVPSADVDDRSLFLTFNAS